MTETLATGQGVYSRKGEGQAEEGPPMQIQFLILGFPQSNDIMIRNQPSKMQFELNDTNGINELMMGWLDELVDEMEDDLTIPKQKAPGILKKLARTGRAAYSGIFDEQAGKRFQKYEEDAKKSNSPIEVMVYASSGFKLFWEMLYPNHLPPTLPVDPSLFFGMRYPIGRAYYGQEIIERIHMHQGLFAAVHSDLKDSIREVATVEALVRQFASEWHLPINVERLEQLLATLSEFSSDELTMAFHDDSFRYGILHFACHHENPKEQTTAGAYLSLTRGEEDEELDIPLEMLLANREFGFVHHPFVFLNACETANPSKGFETFGFPSQMLQYGAGAVIATACAVPDTFASAFGVEFYKNLITMCVKCTRVEGKENRSLGRASIARALLKTRQYFWENYNNPLGLAYGLYAITGVQLDMTDAAP